MDNVTDIINKLRESIESAAFLVATPDSQSQAHTKLVQSLVLLDHLEQHIPNASERVPSFQAERNSETVALELQKLERKLPRWRKNTHQKNSQILIEFLKLSKDWRKVAYETLKAHCRNIDGFERNYNQMKNFGDKNHGKVFDERDGYVELWEPAVALVLELFGDYEEA